MRTLVVILAKGDSSRVPKKNITLVGGDPLLKWSMQYARRCEPFADYVVMTDSVEVEAVAKSIDPDVEVVFERDRSDAPVCRKIDQVVAYHEEDTGVEYQCIIGLNADCPVRPPGLIERMIEVHSLTGCDATETVCQVPIEWHPNRLRIIRRPGDCYPYVTQNIDHEEYSQFYQPIYAVVGAAFSCSRSHLRKAGWMGNRHLGIHLRPIIIPHSSYLEIDTPEQLAQFRKLIECKA